MNLVDLHIADSKIQIVSRFHFQLAP